MQGLSVHLCKAEDNHRSNQPMLLSIKLLRHGELIEGSSKSTFEKTFTEIIIYMQASDLWRSTQIHIFITQHNLLITHA